MLTTAIAMAALVQTPAISVAPLKTFTGVRTIAVATPRSGAKYAVASEDMLIRIMDSKAITTVHTLQGHPAPVYALAFSYDGKWLASGDETGRIYIWNVANGQKVREFPRDKGHVRGIQALSFNKEGSRLVSCGKDDVLKIWKTEGGHPISTIFGNGANFYGLGFTSTGGLVVGTLKEGARIYNPNNGQVAGTMTLKPMAGANNIDVNMNGTQVVATGRDGSSTVFDLKTKLPVAKFGGHQDWVMDAAFTPNGRFVFTSSNDRTVRIGDLRSKTTIGKLEPTSFVGSPLAVTADGRVLIGSTDADDLRLYSITPPQPASRR